MLSYKHTRRATLICIACSIPLLLLSIYALYPHRDRIIGLPDIGDYEQEPEEELESSTYSISSKATQSIHLGWSATSTSSNPAATWDSTYGIPLDDQSAEFLATALGNPTPTKEEKGWEFDPAVDGGNYGLSDWKCNVAFPQMYAELNRAVSYTHANGNITALQLTTSWKSAGLVRAMIYDRTLYVVDAKYDPDHFDLLRALALLSSIERAILTFDGEIPNIEFTFSVEDIANYDSADKWPLWALARPRDKEEQWVMPDFGFWAWDTDLVGSYEQVQQRIKEVEPEFYEKIPQAVWRGGALNQLRQDLLTVTRNQSWADVQEIKWGQPADEENQFMKIADHCKYTFLVQTEGISYSGRLKYLLNCQSVSVIHKLDWIENYHHLLVSEGPHQNYVEVERNFTDLPEKIEYLLDNPEVTERIANNSVAVFRDRYLTPAAQTCYWRRLFRAWRSVSFEPQLYENVTTVTNGRNNSEVRYRGMPWQTYLMVALRDVQPHTPAEQPDEKPCGGWKKFFWLCQ